MVFRLPTHVEPFALPPSELVPQSGPWRGSLIASGLRASDKESTQDLSVTAVETDGDNRSDLWPSFLYAHPTHDRPILAQVQDWVRRHAPPLCTFMPNRLRDPNATTVNQANFRSFSRILFENQMVALAPWYGRIPGAGIIIYPTQNSTALLVGAIFLSSPFPEFVAHPGQLSHASVPLPPLHYQDHIASSSSYVPHNAERHATSSHRLPQLATSTDQDNEQDHYRYMMPRPTAYPTYPPTSSAADPSWAAVKNEEEGNLAEAYVPSHRTGLGQSSQYPQ